MRGEPLDRMAVGKPRSLEAFERRARVGKRIELEVSIKQLLVASAAVDRRQPGKRVVQRAFGKCPEIEVLAPASVRVQLYSSCLVRQISEKPLGIGTGGGAVGVRSRRVCTSNSVAIGVESIDAGASFCRWFHSLFSILRSFIARFSLTAIRAYGSPSVRTIAPAGG